MIRLLTQEATDKPRSRNESRAETRAKLVDSARIVFAQEGYERASIDKIAQHAGFSKGAFYANFGSKEEMFTEIFQEYVHGQRATIRELLGELESPEEIIAAISSWSSRRTRNEDGRLIVVELLRHALLDKALSAKFAHVLSSSWKELGLLLYRIFPTPADAPASPEELGALVMELTYGQGLTIVNSIDPGVLVHLALTAAMQAADAHEKHTIRRNARRRSSISP